MSGHDEALVAKAAEAIAEWRWGRSCHPASSADFARARAVLDAVTSELQAAAVDQLADRWQWGEWIHVPHRVDPLQGKLASGQYVTDWLRANASRLREAG